MAKNYVAPGETVTLTAPTGGVVSGQGVVIGNLFAVATGSAAEGAEFEAALTGVWSLPKAAGAIDAGARVWFDASAGTIKNASASGLYPVGTAVAAALDAATTCAIRLDGVAVTAVPGP